MTIATLKGRTALVTGAAKRIGRAISLALAGDGADVIVHYHRSSNEANALRTELQALGVNAWTIKADFGNRNERESLMHRATEVAGSLDILINSASVFATGSLDDMTLDDLMRSIEINTWAPFALARAFAAAADKGAIVNILDTRIADIDLAHPAYILAKKTLHELTKMMAIEFAPGITVNAVAPGLILPPSGKPDAYLEKLIPAAPLKRHGRSEDIAGAVLFLVRSDFITGQTLFVDGGRHLKGYPDGSNLH